MKSDPIPDTGVYYNPCDYAGILKRVAIICIDVPILILIVFIIMLLWFMVNPETNHLPVSILWIVILVSYLYLAVLKPSRIRTVGYMITGVKIVDLRGRKPSFIKMLFRYLLLFAGPFEIISDFIWLTGEETKQTFRDKCVGTYVVKLKAQPIGQGPIIMTKMNALGYDLAFREVRKEHY